jgi:hypothetical protein
MLSAVATKRHYRLSFSTTSTTLLMKDQNPVQQAFLKRLAPVPLDLVRLALVSILFVSLVILRHSRSFRSAQRPSMRAARTLPLVNVAVLSIALSALE